MKRFFIILFLVSTCSTLFAQTKKVVADKIIATIADKIILKSDIDNTIHDMQRQNVEIPADAACRLLEQAIALKALVVQAERDSLPVSDEEIEVKRTL